jgi:hypothetical protein
VTQCLCSVRLVFWRGPTVLAMATASESASANSSSLRGPRSRTHAARDPGCEDSSVGARLASACPTSPPQAPSPGGHLRSTLYLGSMSRAGQAHAIAAAMTFDNGPCAVMRGVPRPVALQLEQNLDRWFGSASFRGNETPATRAEWCLIVRHSFPRLAGNPRQCLIDTLCRSGSVPCVLLCCVA